MKYISIVLENTQGVLIVEFQGTDQQLPGVQANTCLFILFFLFYVLH